MLELLAQENFGAGMVAGVAADRIPFTAAESIKDALLDENGNPYRRGGVAYLGDDAMVADDPPGVVWMWSGEMAGAQRTLAATTDDLYVLLDTAWVRLTNIAGLHAGVPGPVSAAKVNGLLFIGGSRIYGGASGAIAGFTDSGHNATFAVGSATVTGTGSSWLATLEPGMMIEPSVSQGYYVVQSIESDTSLTLDRPSLHGGAVSNPKYEVVASIASRIYVAGDGYATIGGRLIVQKGRDIRASNGADTTGFVNPFSFDDFNLHSFTEPLVGIGVQSDRLLVFTDRDVQSVSGLALDIVDPSGTPLHAVQHVADLQLWGQGGLASWKDSLIALCLDGVWAIDSISAPTRLSRSIDTLIRDMLDRANSRVADLGLTAAPGQAAVYRDHFFMPVTTIRTGHGPVEYSARMLVCDLGSPIQTAVGAVFPWVELTGDAACRAVTRAKSFDLLGGAVTGRAFDLTTVFVPDVMPDDETGSHFLEILTRGFTLARGNQNLARRLRLRYDVDGGAAEIAVFVGNGTGETTLTSDGATGQPDGVGFREVWPVAYRGQFAQFRIQAGGENLGGLALRGVEVWLRPSGRTS